MRSSVLVPWRYDGLLAYYHQLYVLIHEALCLRYSSLSPLRSSYPLVARQFVYVTLSTDQFASYCAKLRIIANFENSTRHPPLRARRKDGRTKTGTNHFNLFSSCESTAYVSACNSPSFRSSGFHFDKDVDQIGGKARMSGSVGNCKKKNERSFRLRWLSQLLSESPTFLG